MVSKKWVRTWEDAYRKYGAASDTAARSPTVDKVTAWELACASRAVASAWRGISSDRELTWWALAALESAAEAFEDQARHWEQRSTNTDKGSEDVVHSNMCAGSERGRGRAVSWPYPASSDGGDLPRP